MPSEIEYMTRRGKVRISLGGGAGGGAGASSPGAIIYSPDDGMMYTLIPAMSMYSETDLATIGAPSPDSVAPSTRRQEILATPVVTHTKKFELIAEHRCEHVLVTLAKQQTDICMAKGLGVFIMPAVMGRFEAWQSVLKEANGFPLKVVQPDGSVLMEVTKVERKTLPESMFTVPDSYTRMPDRGGRPPG